MNYSWPWRSCLLGCIKRLTFEMGTHPHGAWVMLERVPSSASKQIAHLRSGDKAFATREVYATEFKRAQPSICGTAKASTVRSQATRNAT
jgi:hypothetical protein